MIPLTWLICWSRKRRRNDDDSAYGNMGEAGMSDSLIAAARNLVTLLDKKNLVVISVHKDLVEAINNLRSALPEQCRAMPGIEPALHRPGCEHEFIDTAEMVYRALAAYTKEIGFKPSPLSQGDRIGIRSALEAALSAKPDSGCYSPMGICTDNHLAALARHAEVHAPPAKPDSEEYPGFGLK